MSKVFSMRFGGVVALTLMLATGCVSVTEPVPAPTGETAIPKTIPTPTEAALSMNDIAGKLPTSDELGLIYETLRLCESDAPGLDSCENMRDSATRYVNGYNRLDSIAPIPGAVIFSLVDYGDDAAGLDAWVLNALETRDSTAGDYDRPPVGTRAGERGAGIEDASYVWGVWEGNRLDTRAEAYDHDGNAVGDVTQNHFVVLTNGGLGLIVRIYWEPDQGDIAGSATDEYLTRILGAK